MLLTVTVVLLSQLHNFTLTLQKGHRYNLDCDEKEAKKARQEEAAKKRGACPIREEEEEA